MNYENKTKEQLIDELVEMRKKISELEESEIERKLIYDSLTQSEQRFRTLVETIPHGIQEIDITGIITFSNPAHSNMHGYKEGDLVGKAIWDMLAVSEEEGREELRQCLEMLVREQPLPTPCITQDRTKDGRVIDVQVDWNYKRDKEGKVTGFISVITDITEHKRIDEELRESHQLMEKTLASLNDAVFIIGADTVKIMNCNPAASKIFGYSRQEIIGKTTTFLHVDETTLEEFRKNLYSSVEERGFLSQFDFRMRRKDGTVFPTEHSVFPLEDANGKRIGWVSVVRDITDRKKAEKEMLKSHKLESLGVLAGGIAHDFNNLLTGIIGNIDLAKLSVSPEDNMFKILAEAEKASLRARDLTQQLLTFSRGGAPIKKTISIRGLIEDSIEFTLRGSNVRCNLSFADGLWPVEVDEGQISQVIQSLIINADQAMPGGGIVKVRCENITVEKEEPLPITKGKYVKIEITDQGVGIPEDYLQKIFDPYFTTKENGSGLGLATSYSIIKRHRGLITVKSETGTGTIFCIYLPASKKKILEEIESERLLLTGKGRILVMDDEAIITDVACEMLKHLGYEAAFARCGEDALEIYKREKASGKPFDAIIIDLTIPGGMGGKETIKKLLEIDPDVKAIVSSGYSNDQIMADYRRYGFRDVVVKPYKLTELSKAVHRVIKGASE